MPRQWATAAKAWGHPFFLRFDHEMNGNWQFPWAELLNGNKPGDYVKAWRHVHDMFTSLGATNVSWVWCPNVSGGSTRPMAQLYPGDAYVDLTQLKQPAGDVGPLRVFHDHATGTTRTDVAADPLAVAVLDLEAASRILRPQDGQAAIVRVRARAHLQRQHALLLRVVDRTQIARAAIRREQVVQHVSGAAQRL